jgi:hypothetical protein
LYSRNASSARYACDAARTAYTLHTRSANIALVAFWPVWSDIALRAFVSLNALRAGGSGIACVASITF